MAKKRILLNWDVDRPDLFLPFIELKEEFEFIILWRSSFSPITFEYPFKEIFFEDFKTPYQILDKVKPDKIIFLSLDSFPQIALNLAARNKGISTYTMHHGIYSSDGLEINKRKEAYKLTAKRRLLSNLSSFYFYFSALRIKNLNQFVKYTCYACLRQRRNAMVAMEKCVFEGRMPSNYIQLSPHNSIVTRLVDHLNTDDRFLYIGHPFFDKIFETFKILKEQNRRPFERYFLLIDFANIPTNLAFKIIKEDGKREFYKRLSSLAKSFGCRLKIKLHPAGFNSPYNYKDDNIDLIKEADIASLIFDAEKTFSFYSTLVIPTIFEKGFCYLFDVGMNIQIQNEFVELGVARLLDYNKFTEEDLKKDLISLEHKKGYKTFIKRYLYYTDGKATERLKNILRGLIR